MESTNESLPCEESEMPEWKKAWLQEPEPDSFHFPALHQEHIDQSPESMVIKAQ